MKPGHADEWERVRLSQICRVEAGQGAPQGDNWFKGGNIFVRAGDLNRLADGILVGDFCGRITDEAVKRFGLRLYRKNSIVFPKSGMSIFTENIAILKHDSYVVNHLAVLEFESLVDAKYVLYQLQKLKIRSLVKNPSYPSIRISDIKDYEILWPDKSRRQRIVSILEEVDRARVLRAEADSQVDELVRSLFYIMFGNLIFGNEVEWEPLRNVLRRIESGLSPNCEPHPRENPSQTAVLKLGSVTYGSFNPNENKYLPPETKLEKRVCVKKGDVLFSRKNTHELVAASAYVFQGDDNLLLPDTIFKLVYDPSRINGIYLWRLLCEPNIKRGIQSLATGSAGSMPNISKDRLMKFRIPVPPISLQNKLADIVRSLMDMRELQEHSKSLLDTLFNSRMQEAFEGGMTC